MDLKTKAIVLRRVNYGEADRILELLTEKKKISVIAKSVRKERSRLAGGIELFSLSEVIIRKGKGDLGILTTTRLLEFWGNIMKNLEAMSLAGKVLKDISHCAEQVDSPIFFNMGVSMLRTLNKILIQDTDMNKTLDKRIEVARTWWELNLTRLRGGEINLMFDVLGANLLASKSYNWDFREAALIESEEGPIGSDQIKLMRLMLSSPLDLILKVKGVETMVSEILYVAKNSHK